MASSSMERVERRTGKHLPSFSSLTQSQIDDSPFPLFSVVNPSTGKEITKISLADLSDVDVAVASARKAFNTTWGLHAPGHKRAKLLAKLADIMEEHADEMAAVEALDNGKTFFWAKNASNPFPQVAEDIDTELNKYKQDAAEITRSTGVSDVNDIAQMSVSRTSGL